MTKTPTGGKKTEHEHDLVAGRIISVAKCRSCEEAIIYAHVPDTYQRRGGTFKITVPSKWEWEI